MARKTIQIADKPTVDEILRILENAKLTLEDLQALLGKSANAESVAVIKALLENEMYGLNAIKTAITGRANETTATAIKALLENATYGLDALKSAISSVGLKSVQRGNLHLDAGAPAGISQVTISAVNISKSFVTSVPSLICEKGYLNYPACIRIVNSTTIEIAHPAANGTNCGAWMECPWQVVEFY